MRVSLRKVTHRYGETGDSVRVEALRNLDLEIESGRFLVVMGPSGSGKSTLLHLIGAVERPTQGEVWLDDAETSRLGENDLTLIRREKIGFIFQFFNLIPTLSVIENIAFPLQLGRRDPDEIESRVEDVLTRIGLEHRRAHYPNQLSGGEMQRVAIGRAIAHRPALLLADEPTGNLDTRNGDRILALIREIHQRDHPTIVLATHSEHAAASGEARIEIVDGRIV
ncbi:MAG TPA: ABC transporter ATP-binding protein [Thermoanaerobaculia bacterium]|nr:ABC transporter ATP-binding protein [Thermoanaerobaculia bacterium]